MPARILIDLTQDDDDDDDDDVIFIRHKESRTDDDIVCITRARPLPLPINPISTSAAALDKCDPPVPSDTTKSCDIIGSCDPCHDLPAPSLSDFSNIPLDPFAPLNVPFSRPNEPGSSHDPSHHDGAERDRQATDSVFDLDAYLASSSRRFLGFPEDDGIIDLSVDD